MGTIVKFNPDMDYYYNRGITEYENDNFTDAIRYFREAYEYSFREQNRNFNSIMTVEMACCYRNLNLMHEAQLMYYKTLADCDPDTAFDSVLGLIDIFTSADKEEPYKYYMNYAAKKGFNRELDFIEATAQFREERDFHIEPTPDRAMYNLGKKLMDIGQLDFARQILETIPEGAPSYADASVKLATLYNECGEYERALERVKAAGEYDTGVECGINEILALYKLDKLSDFDAAIEGLESDPDDVAGLIRIVHVMAMVGKPDQVIKFGRKLYRLSPQRLPMLCYAIALANSGELREARKVMVLLQALYPCDARVRIFSSLIAAAREATDLSLMCEIPEEVEESVLGELNGVLSECDNDRQMLTERLRDPKLRTGVLMVFQFGSDNSKRLLCDVVADIPFYEEYMRDCLMDPGYPEADKRIIFPIALKRFHGRPLYLTMRDVARPHCGKPPAKTNEKWKDVYCKAYSVIAMLCCQGFEKEFNREFNKLYAALSDSGKPDENAAAAVLVSRMEVIKIIGDDASCIELFEADENNYYKYKALTEGKTTIKNKKDKGGNGNV